jgi:GTP:adenosylcobinamide-phosphate guanylyltransferase
MRYETGQIEAIVLAGGLNRIPLYEGYTPGYKALLSIGGKPLIRYTLEGLEASLRVRRTCVVGPPEVCEAVSGPYDCIEGGATVKESIYIGLRHFSGSPLVLLITADLPLVTPAAINDFLDESGKIETRYRENVFWALLPETSFTGPYRQVKKGYNRFRDIAVCHGNLLLITPSLSRSERFLTNLDRIYEARKDSVKAALSVGVLVGAAYALGVSLFRVLSLNQMAGMLSRYFGAGLIPVLIDHPEAAVDIDEPADYRFAREELLRKSRNDS